MTVVEIGEPAKPVCVRCNTEEIVPRDCSRGYVPNDDAEYVPVDYKRWASAYKRTVPKARRGGWARPFGKVTE